MAVTIAAVTVAVVLVINGPRLPGASVTVLTVLLAGYAALGRSFAYLGYPPVFLGECALVMTLAGATLTPARRFALDSSLAWLIAVFALWGVTRTFPFIPEYGMDAARDAVVWVYAGFALGLAACVRWTGAFHVLAAQYARALPWFLVWVPCAFLIVRLGEEQLPTLPWAANVAVLSFKPGDIGAHLGGGAAFVLLGMKATFDRREPSGRQRLLLTSLWWGAAAIAFSLNRGAFLAVLSAVAVVAALRPRIAGVPAAAAGIVIVLTLLVVMALGSEDARVTDEADREVSIAQLTENVRSIFGSSERGNLDGTREWRLSWWRDIVGYTFGGEYFAGKGFGINLGADDGYGVYDDSLRSPHNIHMTVLARAGVPGLVLWAAVNLAYALMMLRAHRRARRLGDAIGANLCAWLLAYWAALLVNGSFDVFIEGPPGGIWFWSIIGAGIVAAKSAGRDAQMRRSLQWGAA